MASMLTLTTLRDVIVDALKTKDIATIGDNVYSCRTENAWNDEGNFICVYTNDNRFDDGGRSPVVYKVTSEVTIDVVVQGMNTITIGDSDVDMDIASQMDYITQKVLDAVCLDKTDTNIYRNLPFKMVRLSSVQNTLAGNGEMDKGTQRIALEYTWYMELPTLGSPDDEFLLAHTTIKSDNAEETFDTETRSDQ